MALSGGSSQASTSVKITGKLPGPGNTAGNTIPETSRTVAGGGTCTLDFGVGRGRACLHAAGQFQIAAGGTLTLDLYAGGVTADDLTDVFNGSAPFRLVKLLAVDIAGDGDDASSAVRVGGASSNEWVGYFETAGDSLDIYPDGMAFAVAKPAGVAVGSATKNLAIENRSTTAARIVQVSAAGSRYQSGEWTGLWGFMTYDVG